MKDDVLKLENQLCFPLYACSRAIIKAYNPFLRRLDLTYTQYLVMLVLWTEKRINVKKLGEYLHLDSGTLTPLLKTEPEKALQVFLRAREQIAADRKLGTQPVYPSGNTERVLKTSVSFHGAALATALQQTYNSIPAGDPLLPRIIAAATAMMATDQGCGVESSRDISYDLGGLLTKAGTPPEKDAKFSIERLVASVGP